ncbi:MAG: LLM class flavin-dependent oxidoreductase [Burkholderiaceae bacterium]|nr:LLM class flavin-dependent oxidoreductase [Microbacteriaceae bacterium]
MTPFAEIPLSVLDLATVREGMSHGDALAETIETAVLADSLGYGRFWVAEHHGMAAVASSAPAVLIGAIAAATQRIRVGSGGVMLPNHSSLVIAEQFGTLVALHGDRIDLGLGRAPGTDGHTAAVLRRNLATETEADFPQQVIELLAFFGTIPPLENGLGARIMAIPGHGDAPLMWLLGSSGYSAQLAGMMGLPFVFAHHFAGGDQTPRALELYRRTFAPSAVLDEPLAMVSLSTIVADDAEQATRESMPHNLWAIRLRQGGSPGRVPTLGEADAYDWSVGELAFAEDRNSHQAIGTIEQVRARIEQLVEQTGANEVIIAPNGASIGSKLRTLTALRAA